MLCKLNALSKLLNIVRSYMITILLASKDEGLCYNLLCRGNVTKKAFPACY